MIIRLYFLRRIIFLLFFLQLANAFAQNSQEIISKLKSELSTNPDTKRKAVIFSDLTWYYGNISIDSALHYGNKALKESTLLKDSTLLAQVNSDIASVFFNKSDFNNSEKYYLKALEIRKKRNDIAGINKIKVNLGNIYRKTYRPTKAMNYYIETLKYFEEKNNLFLINSIKANMGLVFTDTKNYPKAKKYFVDAIVFFEDKKDATRLCENYMNLGQIYFFQKDYINAETFYKKSLDKCTEISNKRGIAYAYRNLAALENIQNKDSLAKINLQKSSKIREEFNSEVDLASIKSEIAENFTDKNNYENAKSVLLNNISALEKQKSYKNLSNFYSQLARTYAHLNQPDSADFYLKKYTETVDLLNQKLVTKHTQELEAKYQTEKKDKEIIENKSKLFRRNVFIFSLLGLLGFAMVYYRNYQHKQKLKLQREILHQQDLAAKAVMQAEDHERKRMAIHLHDGVGQLLSAANMNIQVLEDFKEDENGFDAIISKTKNILKEAVTEVRTLSHQIMPNMLIKNSLGNALKELVNNISGPKLKINLHIEGLQENLDENIQVVMFRVIQECINNTIKHAEASEVTIEITQNEKRLKALFIDNGKGFSIQKSKTFLEGMGLENIKSRIELLKGDFKINSSEGNGTKISVSIPLK